MPRSVHLPDVFRRPLPTGPRVRRIARGPARGLAFTIDFDRHLRFYLGLYETEIARWLARFATPGTVAYDIGADVGYQAIVLARRTQAPVVAFEPRADAASQTARHYELNRDRVGPVQVVRTEVGATTATGTVSLDDFEAQSRLAAPGLLLVDVDGSEAEVLAGAARLLRDVKPHLIVETHSIALERDCIEKLQAAGYRPVVVNARRFFGDFRPIEHNRWIAAAGISASASAASR
jgi:methyltransferase FkbM-like protein